MDRYMVWGIDRYWYGWRDRETRYRDQEVIDFVHQ